MPRDIQVQIGWGSGLLNLVSGNPASGRGLKLDGV